jgi:hypothetical protein
MANGMLLVLAIVFLMAGIALKLFQKYGIKKLKTGADEMDILKEKVNQAMNTLNQEWIKVLNIAVETGNLNTAEMFSKSSELQSGIKKQFIEARNRLAYEIDILEENVYKVMNELNQAWIHTVNESIQTQNLDIGKMFGKYSRIISTIDKEFIDARDRVAASRRRL